jgi:hypothetical protein
MPLPRALQLALQKTQALDSDQVSIVAKHGRKPSIGFAKMQILLKRMLL